MKERTLVLIKPDGVQRGLAWRILQRFQDAGFVMIALKMLYATPEHLNKHFPESAEWIEGLGRRTLETYAEFDMDTMSNFGSTDPYEIGIMVKEWNREFYLSGPVIVCVLEGVHAVGTVRKIVGETLSYRAAPGTVRGDFSIDSPIAANQERRALKNVIHASGEEDEAIHEIEVWFPELFTEEEQGNGDYSRIDQHVQLR